jgi:dimethylargininase
VCQADDHFFIGLSHRTNEAGAQQLAQLLSSFGCTSSLIEIRDYGGILHLKSGLAYVGQNRLIIDQRLAVKKEFKDYDLVVVDEGEEYGANCLLVNDHLLLAHGFPRLEQRLKQCDFHVTTLYTSEFQKMDGGLSCLSLRF